jgi:membrane protease YdiL (CAAX protease family)
MLEPTAHASILAAVEPPTMTQNLVGLGIVGLVTALAFAAAVVARRFAPLPTPTRADGPRAATALGIGFLTGVWLIISVGVVAVVIFGEEAINAQATKVLLISGIGSIAAAVASVLVARRIGGVRLRLGLDLGGVPEAVFTGIGWAMIVVPAAAFVTLATAIVREVLNVPTDEVHPIIGEVLATDDTTRQLVLLASAVVVAPLAEEILVRGLLQTLLVTLFHKIAPGRSGIWIGIVLASLFFTVLHPPFSYPTIFALSMMFGYLYERSGNLWVPIIVHAIFNAVSIGIAFGYADQLAEAVR